MKRQQLREGKKEGNNKSKETERRERETKKKEEIIRKPKKKVHILPAEKVARDIDEKKPKIRKINIPNIKKEYSVAIKITNKDTIRDIPIPDFIISILSLGKIPVGKISLISKKMGDEEFEFSIDFTPSQVLKLITRHERFSYLSHVFFDAEKGFLTKKTHFIETKTDGRIFEKSEKLTEDMKDPVALILDIIAMEKGSWGIFNEEEKPFEIKSDGNMIKILPKDEESKTAFSSVRLELESMNDIKLPKFFAVEGLFSLIDIVAEHVN